MTDQNPDREDLATQRMIFTYGGHTARGVPRFTTERTEKGLDRAVYTVDFKDCEFLCGPHDQDGKHVEQGEH